MVRNYSEEIPMTQSPSITQETKARFNELLNAALSKEAEELIESSPSLFKKSNVGLRPITGESKTPDSVPKAVPRLKKLTRSSATLSVESYGHISSVHSSEESSGGHRAKREVIAEVHSSRTRLLASSSEDDILAEKKEKKQRKKSRWKPVKDPPQLTAEEGQENLSFRLEDEAVKRSSSRTSRRSYVVETPTFSEQNIKLLTEKEQSKETSRSKEDLCVEFNSPSPSSNKSYVLETPTFPAEEIQLITSKSSVQGSSDVRDNSRDISPSRISSRSYTLETPTILVEPVSKDEEIVLLKPKRPVPLPRKKSLKSPSGTENDFIATPRTEPSTNGIENEKSHTIITIHDSASQGTDDDLDTSRSAAVKLQELTYPYTEEEQDMPLSVKKQKRKKKKRKCSKPREEVEMQEYSVDSSAKKSEILEEKLTQYILKSSVKKEKDIPTASKVDQIVGVTIHGVDCPITDLLVRHPVIKLYVVDTCTGEYYSKSDPERNVCYFEEHASYVQPLMTHPYDFKQRKSVVPQWEECLLLNESFSHLIKEQTLLLFELCDFVPAPAASVRHSKLESSAGWHIVAWAFLKPVATSGAINISAKLRLQLFKPGKHVKPLRTLTPTVYEWWGSAGRHKYPGCLLVTLSAVDPPSTPISPRLRSRVALQAEQGSLASVRSASILGSDANSDDVKDYQDEEENKRVVWSRLAAQSCKIPNSRFSTLPVDGSMCVQFSGDGLWLACAKQEIQVFSVPQFQHTLTLSGHQGLVYSLKWHSSSKILLSASADCTVCVWKVNSKKNPLLQMLGHTSFVYCAQFLHTPGYCTVVTGCYDSVVRVWQGETHSSYQLTQELLGHAGFVTSVSVTVDGDKVISADSQGSLRVYDVEDSSLSPGRELRVREIRGTTVSNVLVHPGGHRLIVHTRDNTLRSVDIATGAVIQIFKGCESERMQTGACVSACGGLVFACGEDGAVLGWDGHTGALRAVYCGLLPSGSAALHYHPYEHMLAVASLTQPPVFILAYNVQATGEDIGLTVIKSGITAAEVVEKMRSIQNSNRWQKAMQRVISSTSRPSSAVIYQEKPIAKEKKKKGAEKHEEEQSEKHLPSSTKWPSLPYLESCLEKPAGEYKDFRLLEIIQKMDRIILAAKQSSQSN